MTVREGWKARPQGILFEKQGFLGERPKKLKKNLKSTFHRKIKNGKIIYT